MTPVRIVEKEQLQRGETHTHLKTSAAHNLILSESV